MGAPTGFLSRTPFFGGLPPGTLEALASLLVEGAWARDSTVFREGEPGRSMYVVESGDLAATRGAPGGPTVELLHFGPGDFFGETTLIEQQPRPYTVVAQSDARLWQLDNLDLYRLYRHDVKGYVLVLQNINRELCRRLRAAGQRLSQAPDLVV